MTISTHEIMGSNKVTSRLKSAPAMLSPAVCALSPSWKHKEIHGEKLHGHDKERHY